MAYAAVLVHSERTNPIRVIQATALAQDLTKDVRVFLQQVCCQVEAAFFQSIGDDGREQVLEAAGAT